MYQRSREENTHSQLRSKHEESKGTIRLDTTMVTGGLNRAVSGIRKTLEADGVAGEM